MLLIFTLLFSKLAFAAEQLPPMGNWTGQQVNTSFTVCMSHALQDNATDRDRVSFDALAYFCGCELGYWSTKTAAPNFQMTPGKYLDANTRLTEACKLSARNTKPISLYGKLSQKASEDDWRGLMAESLKKEKGRFRLLK